ncbi:MAG TPA: DUF1499 domain-containing protein [Xanthobacteraceae bacterium]|jgi:uncharacterized protein (DUF1499 family)|nr:DUF1499 domain-containing protein [Xanthobacteraceae bacterium]
MNRRRLADEPTSRLAIWARRIAVFSLVATFLSIIIVRAGLLEIWPALATFAGALALAVAAIVLAVGAFVVIWREGYGGLGHAILAVIIGLALLAYPSYLGIKAYRLPAIADITTDPLDPPRFEAIARLRGRDSNPVVYAGLYAAEQQREAYPEVEPLIVTGTPESAYNAALSVITKRKWRIVDARAPQAGRRDGHIEAVARTPIMGFRDDVVVRVRSTGDSTRIDVRSASRYGQHDFGTNAARIRSLIDDIDDYIGNEKLERPPTPQKASQPAKRGQPARR